MLLEESSSPATVAAMLNADAARHLNVERQAHDGAVMNVLLTQARVRAPDFNPPGAIGWFSTLANVLSDLGAQDGAEELMAKLKAWEAPLVLSIIAPQRMAPHCSMRELPAQCVEAIADVLPGFLATIKATWDDESRTR
jgi:hypothetical protein